MFYHRYINFISAPIIYNENQSHKYFIKKILFTFRVQNMEAAKNREISLYLCSKGNETSQVIEFLNLVENSSNKNEKI